MTKKTVVIINEQGIHARPAQVLSKEAMKFNSELQLIKNNDESRVFNPKSILSVMGMGAVKGDEITLVAEGEDEATAIETLSQLFEEGFGE